ncbi:MAG TPA: hypothetical protein VMX79_12495 [bacterium]|nr:hypothetical protein [bacterium]
MPTKRTIITALAVASAGIALGFERNPGGDAGAAAGWGLGARAEALGRAYTALAGDAAAVYWNPAGLAALERTELAFAYGAPFGAAGDVTLGDVVVAKPLLYTMGEEAGGAGSLGTLAAAVAFRRAGGIIEADENGPTGRTFADTDVELYLGYAHALGSKAAFGLALKNVTRKTADYSDSGFGLDLGGTYKPLADLTLGAVVRNVIAPNFRLKALKDAPPLTLELGAGYEFFNLLSPTASLEITREGFYDVGAGVEITPVKYVALRGGYYTGDERPRAGIGFALGSFRFDYGLRIGGPLGDSHLASVSLLLGGVEPPPGAVVPEEEGYIEFEPEEEPSPESEGAEGEEETAPGIPGIDELFEESSGGP